MTEPLTQEDLIRDLQVLGVAQGDTLFVHSSYKSVGQVEGGAETIVNALGAAVGEEGTILMPSFNLVQGGCQIRADNWDIETTPSTVGWLTEFFRTAAGVIRSDHYSHSVAARGKDAEWFVSGHLGKTGMRSPWDREPWGLTYGDDSPMIRAMNHEGSKILMLGVDYDSSTYVHVVEVIDWHLRQAQDPSAESYTYKPREELGKFWESVGSFRRGFVGQADSRLFAIKPYVDALLVEVQRSPQTYCPYLTAKSDKKEGED